MKTRDVIWQHIESRELCPGSTTLTDWLDGRWLTVVIFGRVVPILPMWGLRNALTAHDIHHVMTGYDTSLAGEAELGAWELASGGCGLNLFFWIDRLTLIVPSLLLMPLRTSRAARRGWRCHNLYRRRRAGILDMEWAELQRIVDPDHELG